MSVCVCYDSTVARNGKLYFALINMKEGRKTDLSGANLNKCVELLLGTATSGVEVFISQSQGYKETSTWRNSSILTDFIRVHEVFFNIFPI